MRNRVLLHKLKFDSHGDFDRSAQNSKTVTIAHLDMTGAVDNQDYYIKQTANGTFRGQSVRVMRILIHHDWLTSNSTDWKNATNLAPKWGVKLNTQTNRYEFNEFSNHYHTVPIGVKPADWDYRWYDKYYTKINNDFYFDNRNSLPVTYPRGISNTSDGTAPYTAWDASTQYYTADDGYETNVIWVTDRLMSLGGWSTFETWGTANYPTYLYGFANGFRGIGQRFSLDRSYYRYTGGRAGFAVLDTVTRKLTSYVDNLIPGTTLISPNSYTRNSDVFLSKRTTLINDGHWEQNLFMFLVAFEMDGIKYVGVMMGYQLDNDPTTPRYPCIYAIEDLDDETLSPWGVEPPPSSGYSGPTSTAGGGGGATYTDTDNGIIVTGINGTLFTGSVSGGFKTYDLDSTTLNQTINAIFDGEYSEKMVAQMTTGVIDCYGLAIPATSAGDVDITVLGETMQIGGNTLSAPIIAQGQNFVNCGSISLDPFYDSFLDFEPYTTAAIYIPFIGKFEIPVNDIVHGSVSLKYRQDNYTGDLVAFVEATGLYKYPSGTEEEYTHPIGEFSGNGKYTLPINVASKNNNSLTAALSAGGKIVGGVAAGMQMGSKFGAYGAAAGVVIGGAIGAVSSMQDLRETNSAPLTGHTVSGMTGSQGWLGHMTPYIAITRSMYAEPETFSADIGYTSNISYRIGGISGWTICKNADLSGITNANDREKAEILALIKSGIYVGGSI